MVRPPAGCNQTNQHQYMPILPATSSTPITIDPAWSSQLPTWIQESLRDKFPNAIYDSVVVPNDNIDKNPSFWEFYVWYFELYDMYIYRDVMEDTCFLKLNPSQKKELTELCNLGILRRGLNFLNLENCVFLESIIDDIRVYLKKQSENGVFVKLSQKSAKNEMKLYPAFTVSEVFDQLVHSQEVLKNIPKSTSIVLKPWNTEITKATEHRVFIQQQRVIAISQQEWFTPLKEPPETQGLLEALEELVPKLPCYDCVLDINYKDGKLVLIEVNPGCIWHASGTSLYTSAEILKLSQETSNEIPFRVYRTL